MKTVLIVDDSAFMRLTLKMILERSGFEIIGEASTGIEAIELYKKLIPDFVTMDIYMPEMDGMQALRLIKRIDHNARIVMVSASAQDYKINEALAAGAVSFIGKPFQLDKFETISRL